MKVYDVFNGDADGILIPANVVVVSLSTHRGPGHGVALRSNGFQPASPQTLQPIGRNDGWFVLEMSKN